MMEAGWLYYTVILGGIAGCVYWFMLSKKKQAKGHGPAKKGVIK